MSFEMNAPFCIPAHACLEFILVIVQQAPCRAAVSKAGGTESGVVDFSNLSRVGLRAASETPPTYRPRTAKAAL